MTANNISYPLSPAIGFWKMWLSTRGVCCNWCYRHDSLKQATRYKVHIAENG